jgi:DUF971 family protein
MTPPLELALGDDGRTLEVGWCDAPRARLAAARLRAACRCAACTRDRALGTPAAIDPAVRVTTIAPVGAYGVNLQFSDGHARGIFPWRYLREIDDAISCSTGAAPSASVAPGESTGAIRRNER